MNSVIFIQRGFPVGGIETLILRLANRMVAQGISVTVTGDVGEMSAGLDERVDFFPVADNIDLIRRLPGHIARVYPVGAPVLVSLHPMALATALAVAGPLLRAGRELRSFHLVTHSRAFFFDTNLPGKAFLLKRYFDTAPRRSTYFMNDAALMAHAAHWHRDLSDYPVLRLALGSGERRWFRAKDRTLSIVSVGRLVPFKSYNLAAPAIVRRLRDQGFEISWTIWGFGEIEAEVRAAIAAHYVGDHVRLAGSLPYVDMVDEICRHDLFIGMGTAVLEAATAGVPSLCAVENGSDQSYGFLDEAPLDSLGDVVPGAPMWPLDVDISRYARLGSDGREERSRACADSAADRSASLDEMIAAICSADPWHPSKVDVTSARLGIALERARNSSYSDLTRYFDRRHRKQDRRIGA